MGVARKRRKNSSKKSSLSWKAVEVGDGTTPLQMTAQDWSSFGALEELADYSLTKKNGVVVVENAGQASACSEESSGNEEDPGSAGSSEDEEQESCRSEESDEEDDDSEDCDASSEGSGGSDGGFEDAEDSDGSVEDKEDHPDSDEDVEENENTDDSDEDVEDKDEESSDGSDENDPVTKAMKFLDERNRRTDKKSIPKDIDMTAWGAYSLPREILNGLRDSGFKEPTPIQSLTLGAAISEKKDIIGAAETGSGKTLAFGLPILVGLVREGKTAGVDALILTPTRELALQIKNHILQVAKYTHVKVACIVGGLSKEKQERVLKKPPQILVATPGRLWEMIQEGNAALQRLPDIKYLVIDEADRMTERGHFEEVESIIQFIRSEDQAGEEEEPTRTAKKRQMFLFSATLTLLHSPPEWLKRKKGKRANMTVKKKLSSLLELVGMEKQPKLVDLSQKQGTAEKLKEAMVPCKTTEKDHLLYYFLHKFPGRTLVFCNSIDCVRRLKNIFEFLQTDPLPLHANMHQKQRLKNLERFSSSQTGFLLASDVAARGLDIPNVQHVIHYQVPRTSESYVHRSGRTARATRSGISLVFVDQSETSSYRKICSTLQKSKELPIFPIDPILLSKARERVQIARELDKISHSMRKSKAERDWMKRNADEMELLLSSDGDSDGSEEETGREFGRKNKRVEALKAQLKDLLKTPLTQEIHRKYLMPGDGELMGNGSLANSRISDQGEEGAAVAALDQELKEQDRLKQSLKKRKSSAWCKKRKKKRKTE